MSVVTLKELSVSFLLVFFFFFDSDLNKQACKTWILASVTKVESELTYRNSWLDKMQFQGSQTFDPGILEPKAFEIIILSFFVFFENDNDMNVCDMNEATTEENHSLHCLW